MLYLRKLAALRLDTYTYVEYPGFMVLHRASLAFTAAAGLILMASCARPTYPKCETDDHCADKGEICVEGSCQQCRADDNCEDGFQCVSGRCEEKSECSTESDCSDNKVCRSGKCQTECEATTDCADGLKCMNYRCVSENACTSSADCSAGVSCIEGVCDVTNASRALALCSYPVVRFDFDQATLTADARSGLSAAADCIQSAGGTLVVEGHCDERGTEAYNLALGDRRAQAVVKYLSGLGVPRSMMRVISKGENEPLVSGSNSAAWAQNRRAEFEVAQ